MENRCNLNIQKRQNLENAIKRLRYRKVDERNKKLCLSKSFSIKKEKLSWY